MINPQFLLIQLNLQGRFRQTWIRLLPQYLRQILPKLQVIVHLQIHLRHPNFRWYYHRPLRKGWIHLHKKVHLPHLPLAYHKILQKRIHLPMVGVRLRLNRQSNQDPLNWLVQFQLPVHNWLPLRYYSLLILLRLNSLHRLHSVYLELLLF